MRDTIQKRSSAPCFFYAPMGHEQPSAQAPKRVRKNLTLSIIVKVQRGCAFTQSKIRFPTREPGLQADPRRRICLAIGVPRPRLASVTEVGRTSDIAQEEPPACRRGISV